MALTPDDIVNYDFKQAMRGYAIPQVDDLLDRLADQIERNEREIDDLRQRLRETEARLGSTLETESTLKRTLVTAQQAAERALEDARQQADELRGAAEREVTEQLENARKEAEDVTVRARQEAEELTSRSQQEAEEALSRARQEAEEVTSRAQQEAMELTSRAQEAARAELFSAREERSALEGRLEELREMEHRHRAIMRRHLEANLAVLDDFDGLPEERDPETGEVVAPSGGPSLQIRVREDDDAPVPGLEPDLHDDAPMTSTPDAPPSDAAFADGPSSEAPFDDAPPPEDGFPDAPATDVPSSDAAPADAPDSDTPSEPERQGTGLFDHDRIDITEEVAVASPWEPAPGALSRDAEPRADAAPPSPWAQETSFPPPDAQEREQPHDSNGAEPSTVPSDRSEPHVWPHEDDDESSEPNPYEQYDRFRDFGNNNP